MADEEQKSSEEKKPICEWILFQIKGGGKIVGLVEVDDGPRDIDAATDLMKKGFIIEVGNVHQVMIEMSPGKLGISAIPMNYGDRRIFLRTEEISFVQFMGAGSGLVQQITGQQTNIVRVPAGTNLNPVKS